MSIYGTNPGKYRHRITIQRAVTSRDPSDGDVIVNWFDFQTGVPAEVLTGPGKENVAADAFQGVETARVNMRWFPGLLSSMRILWEGKTWAIAGPPDTDSTGRREYRLTMTTGAHDGR